MLICGTGSFSHQDEDDLIGSPCRTPKRSKKGTSFIKCLGKDNSKKNPYAKRGLDKFYALLMELDSKKQKIYTQKGSEDISFVLFRYTNSSNRIKPIVVKVKEKKQENIESELINKSFKNINQVDPEMIVVTELPKAELNEKPRKRRRCLRCKENLKRPSIYFPVILVLILLFLAMYGRSFAIMWMSIGWYMVSSVSSSSSSFSSTNEKEPKRKE